MYLHHHENWLVAIRTPARLSLTQNHTSPRQRRARENDGFLIVHSTSARQDVWLALSQTIRYSAFESIAGKQERPAFPHSGTSSVQMREPEFWQRVLQGGVTPHRSFCEHIEKLMHKNGEMKEDLVTFFVTSAKFFLRHLFSAETKAKKQERKRGKILVTSSAFFVGILRRFVPKKRKFFLTFYAEDAPKRS